MFFILSQGDQGKASASDQSIAPIEYVVSDEAIFYSTNPWEMVRDALKKLNIELLSLLKV